VHDPGLEIGIPAAQNAGRGKKFHRCVRDALLHILTVENFLAMADERAIDGQIEAPDEPAKPPGVGSKRLAVDRHFGGLQRSPHPVPSDAARIAQMPARVMQSIPDLFQLHAWSTHPDQRDEGGEHFIRAFSDLVDPRIAQHPLERQRGEVSSAAMDLEGVVDDHPERLGREDLQHRGLDHVILQPSVDERCGDRGHRAHRKGIGSHARKPLLDEFEIAERVAKLPPGAGVMRGQP
jgi:hypothetical protein